MDERDVITLAERQSRQRAPDIQGSAGQGDERFCCWLEARWINRLAGVDVWLPSDVRAALIYVRWDDKQ